MEIVEVRKASCTNSFSGGACTVTACVVGDRLIPNASAMGCRDTRARVDVVPCPATSSQRRPSPSNSEIPEDRVYQGRGDG